ncbi:SMI1/KNR4 family protein [Streptomyces sp. NBC_00687]|uniref:SMI1/KNR4 family protein n=1 Tax=Streptomyces sp. NBC_00687 TaxID=2975807 RepID=UPI00225BB1F3|nr:SMI1/KNR4 family protein [Streptomyces sp. NBC_00687]MCX4911989.1 SMI1/KNR4 family protein [Streptomyces sp. NBC_00687]
MPPNAHVAELMQLYDAPAGNNLRVDWPRVEAAWGFSFPSDFKELLGRYREWLIEGYLGLIAPTSVTPATCDEPGAPLGGMGFITADTRDSWAESDGAGRNDMSPDQIVTWGAASSADLFCWLTQGAPDEWPVLVFTHGDERWVRFPYGVAEFLLRTVRADPEVQIMADTPLWGVQRQG